MATTFNANGTGAQSAAHGAQSVLRGGVLSRGAGAQQSPKGNCCAPAPR
jgi:hypothetical protein